MTTSPMMLRLIGLAAFSSMASMRMCDPMLIALSHEFQGTTGDASAVIAAFAVAYGVLQLVYGPLGDWLGKVRVIIGATGACALFSAMTALAPSLPVLSMLFLTAAVLLYRHAREGLPSASVAAADAPSFSLAAYLAGTVHLLRMPRVRWVLAVVAIEGALAFGTLAFVPARMTGGFGLSASAAGGVMVLYGVGGLLYSVFARRWLAWLGESGLALTGASLIAGGLLLLAWASVVAWAVLGCFLAGLGFYMLHNTLQTQATQMAPQARGTAVTLFACLLFLVQSIGVLAVAASVDRGWLTAVFTGAALGMLALGVLVSRGLQVRHQAVA